MKVGTKMGAVGLRLVVCDKFEVSKAEDKRVLEGDDKRGQMTVKPSECK